MSGPLPGPDGEPRCPWALSAPEYLGYHDDEWGRPVHGDAPLYERICLEGFQAGLSWIVVLRKRASLRAAFADFDPHVLAGWDEPELAAALTAPGIVRNAAKARAVVTNARATLALADGGLESLVWSHRPTPRPAPEALGDVPAVVPESVALARALKRAGFAFVGPTTCYALMQACGLVDDHLAGCAARGGALSAR